MENKIYSRKRLLIPKFNLKKKISGINKYGNGNFVDHYNKNHNIINENNKKLNYNKNDIVTRKLIKTIIVVIIAVCIANKIISVIEPTMDVLCINMAKSIATQISNEQATIVMKNYKYDDISSIVRNEQGDIKMIKMNVMTVNEITSDIAIKIQNALNEYESDIFCIRLGSFSGLKILSGRGPKVPIKMSTVGNVDTKLVSDFSHTGINDTLHRVYLNVECKVTILTPYDTIEQVVSNQVLLAEAVIVGEVPETYYNLNRIENSDMTEVIQ